LCCRDEGFAVHLAVYYSYRIYAGCPNGTFSNVAGDKCYFILNDTQQFISAEMNCQDQNGDLASILNALDNMNLTGKNYGWISLRSSLVVARRMLHAACSDAQCG
jgi:hypothetical protein